MPPKKNEAPEKVDVIQWLEKDVKLKDLKPYERNPRRITEAQYEQLLKSLKENGYHQRILATPDFRIIGGHQRIRAMKQLGMKEIKVLIPDREISDEKFKELLIKDNLPFGEFDFDMLSADFEADQLLAWGMPKDWLPDFTPVSEDEQGKLDEKKPADSATCPECGYEFDPAQAKT